jgi:2-amino-4-hydroxy-6-hydroxymethyldihydropteridine diphosphokinase
MTMVFIGLGSNLGDRIAILQAALERIDGLPGTRIVKTSAWYESEAVGGVAEGAFINGVAQVETSIPAKELMGELLSIEKELGRVRFKKWGDRTCDLDLLIYGDLVLDDPDCTLPHPGIAERRFVLEPLAEIAPDLVLPGNDRTISSMLQFCPDPHWIRPHQG